LHEPMETRFTEISYDREDDTLEIVENEDDIDDISLKEKE